MTPDELRAYLRHEVGARQAEQDDAFRAELFAALEAAEGSLVEALGRKNGPAV